MKRLIHWEDGGASNRVASWWRLHDEAAFAGCTWFLMDKTDRNLSRGSGVACVDDFGDLVRVPYTWNSFNQPEH